MTEWRERAILGVYETMKNNSAIMDVITAVYSGMAPDSAEPIYSLIRHRAPGTRSHYFQEDYPVVGPKVSILTYGTENGEQVGMNLTHATDVIDNQMEAERVSYDGLEFKLQGIADAVDQPNQTSGDTNLIFTRLTYEYQIQ